MKLLGNTISITDAARGIGCAIAAACVHVALLDKDAEKLSLLVQKLQALPNLGRIVLVVADFATEKGVRTRIGEALAEFTRQVGVLVSNIGVLIAGTFEELTSQDWQKSMRLNFLTYICVIKAVFHTYSSVSRDILC